MNSRSGNVSRRAWLAGAPALAARSGTGDEVRFGRPVRVAIVGFDGHTGEITKALPVLPEVEVAAISDASPAALERAARHPRLKAARRYTRYEEMLDREKLDVVAVCNANGDRAAAILACAGRKLNVVAEKPLAITAADLARVRKSVAASGIHLGMLLPMRYSPPYLALKQLVDSGEIGEVGQIAAQKSYKPGNRPPWMRRKESYGGTIPWIGSHMVDLMRFCSGREFTEVVSYQTRFAHPGIGEMENVTGSLFRLDNGGVGTLRMDYFRPETAPTHGDDRLRLAGTRGVAEYQAATGVTIVSAGRKPEVLHNLPPERLLFAEYLESVYNGKTPSLTLADIYRVCDIVLAARESAERRAIVKL